MGASGSQPQIVSGIAQGGAEKPLYKLVDNSGGGELLPWVKHGMRTNDWSILEGYIELKVSSFLLNEGNGRPTPISDLIKKRNEERNKQLGAFQRKKGKGKAGPNVLDSMNLDEMQGGDMMRVLKKLDGGGKGGKGGGKYREICWDIEKRGNMGETLVHVCLLQGTNTHNMLVKRLLNEYPKLVNDIFISEDYYGQTPLHQAVVNEDIKMVRFLLSHDADVNARVYGAFFCCNDQRSGRSDSMEHEWVDLPLKTNYIGRTYWGETPLAFAACTQQEDLFRIIRANKGDPNTRDTNENTVLHMMYMFEVVYKLGGKLHASNRQNLTPLNLAAKLAKAEMFQEILKLEREVLWEYGEVVCAAYPLNYIDTIDIDTGEINENSALSHIVFGEKDEHLDLLPGLMDDLLKEKWHAFARQLFARKLIMFIIYWTFVFLAYYNRPYDGKDGAVLKFASSTGDWIDSWFSDTEENATIQDDVIEILNGNVTTNVTVTQPPYTHGNNSAEGNLTNTKNVGTSSPGFYGRDVCFLLHTQSCPQDGDWLDNCWMTSVVSETGRLILNSSIPDYQLLQIRFSCETVTLVAVFIQITQNILLIRRISWKRYTRTMQTFPANLLFTCSFGLVVLMIPLRLMCWAWMEHILATFVVIMTTLRFLFFCRGFKFVGPLVLMIYKIVLGDMLRFFLIYSFFVMGFSQAFYIIFKSCYRGNPEGYRNSRNIMRNPLEAIARCFIMSLGEFSELYGDMTQCRLKSVGKVLFVLYELLVSIMLINLLIAMMARTYELVVGTGKEWKRQWANVILMLEQSLTPDERMTALYRYSRPLTMDKRKRAFVVMWKRSVCEVLAEESEERAVERDEALEEYREQRRQVLKRRMQGPEHQTTANVEARESLMKLAVGGFVDNATVGDLYD